MRVRAFAIALVAGALVSCSECKAPTGCLSADYVQGVCQCLEWQVVSVENAPVRFVVLNVAYALPGSHGDASYGPRLDGSGLRSEVGSRWRSAVRVADGSEHVAALGRLDLGQTNPWVSHHVTTTSGAVAYEPHRGFGIPSRLDVPAKERDFLEVWVNPVATVTTDYAGSRTVDWSWSGSCFGISCTGAMTFWLTFGEIDGTAPPPAGSAEEMFLSSLTDAERAALLRHHPLYDPPGRDPATLAEDPRFLSIEGGWVNQYPVSSGLDAQWEPCLGMLIDAVFPVLAQTEVPFSGGTLLVQHSVQSISPTCEAQNPDVWLSSTAGCQLTALFYVDLAFGTVLGIPTSVVTQYGTGCTGP